MEKQWRTIYQRGISHTYYIIESGELYEKDYQLYMLEENKITGLLPLQLRGVEGKIHFLYEINRKVSLKNVYEKESLNGEQMKSLIRKIIEVIKLCKEYLLDENKIMLDPESIFVQGGEYCFCYYPLEKQHFCEAFHRLTEFFVERMDYEDKEGIYLAYRLHRVTMEENYCMAELLEQLEEKTELKEEERFLREKKEEAETREEELWEQKRGYGEIDVAPQTQLIREDVSSYFRRKKRKKEKWGDWKLFYH